MIRLLQFILTGCFHKWEIIREGPLDWERFDGTHGNGHRYDLQCKNCGKIMKKDIR